MKHQVLPNGAVLLIEDEVEMATAYPAPIVHPLGPPTLSGTTYTVDWALNNPTRVTQSLMDLTLQRFFADRVFTSAGGVTGGAVIYDVLLTNELYLNRDIGRVSPGAEFPIVTSERYAPQVAEVEKWGAKFYITREARDRNQIGVYTKQIRQLGNTIVRKINQRSIEVLEAAISTYSRTTAGVNWGTVVTAGSSASNFTLWPARDFARCTQLAEEDELNYTYDLMILNPAQYFNLAGIYGAMLADLLASTGYDVFVTPRVTAGTAYAVAQGQVGEMRVEQPLMTETWYDEETQRFWSQSSVRPMMFVDEPHAVLKLTGLAG